MLSFGLHYELLPAAGHARALCHPATEPLSMWTALHTGGATTPLECVIALMATAPVTGRGQQDPRAIADLNT